MASPKSIPSQKRRLSTKILPKQPKAKAAGLSSGPWTFFTNHAHVLICIAENPDMILREVSLAVGITERAVQGIVMDLVEGGVLTKTKLGRSNHYSIHGKTPLRHPLEKHRTVGDLVQLVITSKQSRK